MTSPLESLYGSLSPRVRQSLKGLLHASGHTRSAFDTLKAWRLARGRKRLDRAAADLRWRLHLAGVSSLRGQACLELGAGYVLAEPLLFSLLGARHACALDYNAIATLTGTWHSLRQASPQDVVAALEGIDLPEELAPTLAQLAGGTREAFAERLRQDVAYLAPYDVSSHALTGRYHLIDSVSVLEHVPPSSLRGLLGNLLASLEPGGVCINQIDLRDHRDPEGQPLAFLAEQDYGDALADTCGNRLRRSHWEALFAGFEDYQTVCVHARSVARDKIPAQLAPGFQALEVDDLATTELLMVSRRRG